MVNDSDRIRWGNETQSMAEKVLHSLIAFVGIVHIPLRHHTPNLLQPNGGTSFCNES